MCPSNTACFDFRVDVDDALIQKLYREWLEVGPDYFGDYYPLTAHSLDQDAWIAWQFHRPEAGRGWFRRFAGRTATSMAASSGYEGFFPTPDMRSKTSMNPARSS